jgi:hypothetical protein
MPHKGHGKARRIHVREADVWIMEEALKKPRVQTGIPSEGVSSPSTAAGVRDLPPPEPKPDGRGRGKFAFRM